MDLSEFEKRMAELQSRIKATVTSPEYQANAARLAASETVLERERLRRNEMAEWKLRGIPEALYDDLKNPWATEPLDATRRFMASDKVYLVMLGNKGVGKTRAGFWACAHWGGRAIKAAEMSLHGFDVDWWDGLRHAPVLLVDELGGEAKSVKDDGWQESRFLALMSFREEARRKTIITANLDTETFRQRYGTGALERFYDRLKGSGQREEFDGASLRGREREPGEEG